MNTDLMLVLILLGGAVAMFSLNRPRMDVVGLLMMTALPLTGVLTVGEALAGFSDPNVVLVGLLFVVGESLVRTGVAARVGDWLAQVAGANETRLLVLLMLAVAAIGSVMSSTGVVALFIPVVLRVATATGLAPGRLMMPLSVAALFSGMMTLVATAPNLVVQAELERAGHRGMGFFSLTPIGLPMLALGIGWMLYARRWLGRSPTPATDGAAAQPRSSRPSRAAWIAEYALFGQEQRLRVRPDAVIVGRELAELALRREDGLNVIVIERGAGCLWPTAHTRLEAGDVLWVDGVGRPESWATNLARRGLEVLPLAEALSPGAARDLGLAEVVVPAHSRYAGQTVVAARLRSTLDLTVVGRKHGSTPQASDLREVALEAGDTLLVAGPWRAIRRLRASGQDDLVVLNLPAEYEEPPPAAARAPWALAVLALMVGLMVSGLVPNAQAALIACLLLGATRCLNLTAAYRAIHWPSLVLIAGMLPFSLALERTGGADLAAEALNSWTAAAGPRGTLAVIFGVTAILGLFISNTATAVLMAPVALSVAEMQGASPLPFALTVALAASAAFMTPVSSPVNSLVLGPGGYRFGDFVKVGVPLALLTLLVAVLLVPLVAPF
jgi:di/tricarboxylate transporter